MPWKSYREESKADYGQETVSGNLCNDQLKLGAMLRIADAVEKIALNYQKLIDERDRYKRWYDDEIKKNEKHWRRQSALRGVITKLKKAS